MLRHDLTLALRRLLSSPGFTAAAIVTLALGIGADTTIFSMVNAVVFRPFGVQRQNELVFFNRHTSQGETPMISYPDYKDYRDRNKVLSGLAVYDFTPVNISRGNGRNTRLWGYAVSGNYFDMLGVQPLHGRLLHSADDVRGGNPVAVIAANCWQTYFASDPDIVGKKVKINGLDYTIAGVTPPSFIGTELVFSPQIFIPVSIAVQPGDKTPDDRTYLQSWAVGRLKPGISMQSAQTSINGISSELSREFPKADAGVSIVLSPPGMAGTYLRRGIVGFSSVGMVVAGLVLLLACVNLAGLLMARASDRRKEVAIRLALGASRRQLVKQLLTESLLLSLTGGALGVLVAAWLADLVNAARPPIDTLTIAHVAIDTRVLAFAAAVSVLSALLFGLMPALQSTGASLIDAIKNAPAERFRRFSSRDFLVAVQVSLSVFLLIGSILVVRSLQHALTLNVGFQPDHAAVLSLDLGGQGYDEQRSHDFARRLLEKVRALPGIESAAISSGLPLSGTHNVSNAIFVEGKPEPLAGDVPTANMYDVTPGFLAAMRTRLLAGRDFNSHDTKDAPLVALVNQTFVRKLLPGEGHPIGKRFRHTNTGKWIEIAGIVEDGKYGSLGELPDYAVFEPLDQNWSQDVTLVARSSMPESEVVRQMRHAVLSLDPSLTIFEDGSLEKALGLALFPAKMAAVVLGAFGALALILAATGVYGIMAYAVSKRTREIGIRMALGAAPWRVTAEVLRRTAMVLTAGLAIGLGLAFAGGAFFGQILYGISAHDPLTYLTVIAIISIVALSATTAPARRAAKVDPHTALRME